MSWSNPLREDGHLTISVLGNRAILSLQVPCFRNHSSDHSNKSMEDAVNLVHQGRTSLRNANEGLNDSTASFFSEEMSSSIADLEQLSLHEPTEERRTFEDISMEAQAITADQEEETYEMEIAPGQYLPFRGSKETWRAIDEGNFLETSCLECGLELVSVPDCQCVVCSDCKMVNPIFEHPPGVQATHGVGMGFQKEWIQRRRDRDFSRR